MSQLNKNSRRTGTLGAAIANVAIRLSEQGMSVASKDVTDAVLSMESIALSTRPEDAGRISTLHRVSDEMVGDLKAAFEAAGIDVSGMTPSMLEAGTMAALAAGNPRAYAEQATAALAPGAYGNDARRALASGDNRMKAAFESFDDRELRELLPFSVVFNAFGVRQSEFSETLYRTVVLSPDQAAVKVTVPRSLVFNEVKHDLTGQAANFYMRNVLDAVMDPEVLATNNSLEIVPIYSASGIITAPNFQTEIAAYPHPVSGGTTVQTAPLAVGQTMDLLALSNTPNLNGGVQDSTDALDHLLGLKNIYLRIEDDTPTTPLVSYIKVETQYRTTAHFLPAAEGIDTRMVLNFQADDIAIAGDTKDIGAVTAASLDYLTSGGREHWVVRLAVNMSGTATLHTGNVQVISGPLTIDSGWDTANNRALDASQLATLRGKLPKLSVIGWDPRAYRSNVNKRLRGILTDTFTESETIMIPMGSPISMLSAVTSSKAAENIETVVNTSRYRNDSNAVTQLMAYANVLKGLSTESYAAGRVPNIFGSGRHLLKRAFYEFIDLDIAAEINNLTTSDRQGDVASVIVNVAREVLYRAARETNYMAALSAYHGTEVKPTVVFATDTNTLPHLIVNGDNRLASVGYENYKLVASPDNRMKGKLYMTFVLPDAQGVHPLSFGNFLWMPELAATVPATRNGAVINEATVHPRCIHINNLPILIEINVKNLAEALTKKTAIDFKDVT